MRHTAITPDKAVIYELYIRNFTPEGTINAIIPRLNDLKDLGVNTIWIMPIQPTGKLNHKGTYGSPYSIQDYYAVNPDFGTKEDFRNLVDSIHAKNMSVIIDMVANHTAWDNAWVTQHPDWYTHDSTGKIVSPVPDWTDVADLNYDNKDLRNEMTDVLKYWVDSFDVDGYRCDVAEMVPLDFWKHTITEINKIKPVLMLAEGADPKLIDNGFQLTYGWELYHNLKLIWKGTKARFLSVDTVMQDETKYPANSRRMRFITNHDETSWDNSPVVLFNGLAGSEAAYVIMATMPGVPLVYNGQEVASDKKANIFEKTPIDWSANPDVRTFYKSILALYNSSPVLRNGAVQVTNSGTDGVIAYYRTLGNEKWLIMVNATDKEADVKLPGNLEKDKVKIMFVR